MATRSPAHQAQSGQGVGGLVHLVLQLGIGDAAGIADRLTFPVDGDPVAVAGLDVAVHAVVGDVELAADKPLRERRVRPVQYLFERGLPAQPVGLLGPETEPVSLGRVVQVTGGIGVGCEVRRWRVSRRDAGLRGCRVAHGCEPSHQTLHRRWSLTRCAAGGPPTAPNVGDCEPSGRLALPQ